MLDEQFWEVECIWTQGPFGSDAQQLFTLWSIASELELSVILLLTPIILTAKALSTLN